ncbi:VOC family protein [Tardiphaga sp. 42S5]|uniref:VOC family protein n=1 Tax=Tardiphaga sp. 42S5 TaxID=1404799 RepID=UPI002A59E652|nr:VOC family protein [Tardiphaga sp. 42S5]WPO39383.1 VOC family protein [Tardiphaga sp. 42S5]
MTDSTIKTPGKPTLSYVNVFARDIVALSQFYIDAFGFTEIEKMRSPIFRGLNTGCSSLGFNAQDAYGLLKLDAFSEVSGVKFLITIDVASVAEVERLTPKAVSLGAQLVKPPYKTYYNWYQAVLLDPEQNVFRINHIIE